MAVITPLTHSEIASFLAHYPLGRLLAVEPSTAGIENTTYFITTELLTAELTTTELITTENQAAEAEWVLTLIEHAPVEQVDFTARLLTFLSARGLPVPAPQCDHEGQPWRWLHDKPTWLIRKVPGHHPTRPTETECRAIGDFLGAAHRAVEQFDADLARPEHPNSRGLDWLHEVAPSLSLSHDLRALLDSQLATWEALQHQHLPRGAIHADLFHDNALFEEGRLVAVIDFLFSCTDWLLLDVAIAVNDWCDDGRGQLDKTRAHALLAAYSRHRPFTVAEHQHWQAMLALAATRFWVSRLQPSSDQQTKDPDEYLRMVRNRLADDDAETVPLPLIF